MLSIGIRSGQGFDKETIRKLIDIGKRPYEFDFLILGNNQGGIACAREAVQHGKKVALVYWRIPTPGEQEGCEEDRRHMAEALLMNRNFIINRTYDILEQEAKTELMPLVKVKYFRHSFSRSSHRDLQTESTQPKWCRKVRESRLDLTNVIINMSAEGLNYMHEIAVTNDIHRIKNKSWKVLSWGRMMEQVLDYTIKRNWTILTDFLRNRVSLHDGLPILMDEHTVEVLGNIGGKKLMTAENIISAVEVHHTFPKEVAGAKEYGVIVDDFFRLSTPPGKTLIVGAGPRGMECAGILASFGFPVVVVDRLPVLKNGDREIVAMIVKDLESKGVSFMEQKSLISIGLSKTGKNLVADFLPVHTSMRMSKTKYSEEFDTVLFTTKENINLNKSGITALQFEIERLTGETYTAEEKFLFKNVISIPDRPNSIASAKLIGKHIAEQLLGVEENPPKLRFVPNLVLTPFEYAYVGIPENIAKKRFGEECIKVFTGYIPTKEIIFEKNALKDQVCYTKIIAMLEKDFVIGLHFLGRDAVQIMNKIMKSIKNEMLISNLHPTLRNLLRDTVHSEEEDEVVLKETT